MTETNKNICCDINTDEISAAAERIMQMERLMDEIQSVYSRSPESLLCTDTATKMHALEEYMDSGLWLQDYERDEKGLFPRELKRGVLSEDGLYNLLDDIRQYLRDNE